MSAVVQFRQEDTAVDYLRQRGINPNDFGRQAFEDALRRLQNHENVEKLRELRKRVTTRATRPFFDVDAATAVRRDRDR